MYASPPLHIYLLSSTKQQYKILKYNLFQAAIFTWNESHRARGGPPCQKNDTKDGMKRTDKFIANPHGNRDNPADDSSLWSVG